MNRLFALMLSGAAVWGFAIFEMRSSDTLDQALVWSKVLNVFIPFVVVLMYHFILVFTGEKPRKWIIGLIYGFLIFSIAMVPTDLMISGMQIKPYGYAPVGGPLFYPVVVIDYVLMLLGLAKLIKAYRKTPDFEIKNRYLYVVVGLIAALLGGICDVLPLLGVPLYPGAIFGLIIFYILTTIAIARYHLLNIRIALRKGIAYLLVSMLIAVPYVGVIIALTYYLGEINIQFWGYALLSIGLAIVLQPLWKLVQALVDRWFYGSKSKNMQELLEFGRQQLSIRTSSQVIRNYMDLIQRAMGASGAFLLLPDQVDNFVLNTENGQGRVQDVVFGNSSPFLSWLGLQSQPVSLDELEVSSGKQVLTDIEKELLNNLEANLFIPLKNLNGDLCGILVLTEKSSERPYSGEERSMLMMIANQIAVGLDNVRLYMSEKEIHAELQKQNEQKAEFLYTISYEMKTPLTSLISSSELLEERLTDSDDITRRLISNISSSVRSMNRRISELIDLAEINIESFKLDLELIDPGTVISELAKPIDSFFKSKQQKFRIIKEDDLPKVRADVRWLEQILVNLLSNAGIYSPEGSEIQLHIRHVDNSIVVCIADEAPVIPEAEKRKVLNPYYQGEDQSETEYLPGTRLALNMAKNLVELHEGTIWIADQLTRGNTFCFSLPVDERISE